MTAGRPITPAIIDTIMEDSAALEAGFLPGDHVVRIDDVSIERFEELRDIVMFGPGVEMAMVVIRDNAEIELLVTPREYEFKDSLGNTHVIGRTPLGRPATEQDLAHAVAWLLSSEAQHVTGQNLDVAGGWCL